MIGVRPQIVCILLISVALLIGSWKIDNLSTKRSNTASQVASSYNVWSLGRGRARMLASKKTVFPFCVLLLSFLSTPKMEIRCWGVIEVVQTIVVYSFMAPFSELELIHGRLVTISR